MSAPDDLWIFGYGSLIFRPDFPFSAKVVGRVMGYERRFWQESTDHRGTPEGPGRVLTLVKNAESYCAGVAYRIPASRRTEILEQLDYREKQGYELIELPFDPRRDEPAPAQVSVYLAKEDNAHFCGPEADGTTAAVIREAVGPSGHNVEYLFRLAEALEELRISDEHVMKLANLVADPDQVFESEES